MVLLVKCNAFQLCCKINASKSLRVKRKAGEILCIWPAWLWWSELSFLQLDLVFAYCPTLSHSYSLTLLCGLGHLGVGRGSASLKDTYRPVWSLRVKFMEEYKG